MPKLLRRGYGQLITSGGQLILLLIGAKIGGIGLFVCVALMALLSLMAWSSAYRRSRAVDDTPTSRLASAAQGYVELYGIGKPLGGLPLLSPVNQLACLWYRYTIERKDSKGNWSQESSGESDASFIIDDGTGQCVVDPEGAEMVVTKKESWIRDDRRFTQWALIEFQKIYALGDFITRGSVDLELDVEQDVGQLLAEWKKEPAKLLKRFDLDGNGQIDMAEWELARSQAKREVLANHRELRAAPELNVMQLPADGKMYVISDLSPADISKKYRLWSWLHIVIFFGSLIALPLLLSDGSA